MVITEKNRIRARIWIPFAVATLLGLMATVFFVYHQQEQEIQNFTLDETLEARRNLEVVLQEKEVYHQQILHELSDEPELKRLYRFGSEESLRSFLSQLKEQYEVLRLCVYTRDRKGCVCLSQGDSFLNSSSSLDDPEETTLFSGLAVNQYGSLSLRSVRPWYDHGELIGYLVMEDEIQNYFEKLDAITDASFAFFVLKNQTSAEAWLAGKLLFGFPEEWDDQENLLFVGGTITGLSPLFFAEAGTLEAANETKIHDRDFRRNGKSYRIAELPLRNGEGTIVGELAVLTDVTEYRERQKKGISFLVLLSAGTFSVLALFFNLILKRIEKRIVDSYEILQASEAKFRGVFERSNDAIVIHDKEGEILEVNQRCCGMMGYSKEVLKGRNIREFNNDKNFFENLGKIVKDEISAMEGGIVTSYGLAVDVEFTASFVDLPLGIVQTIFHDITERKKAEMSIKTSEERLRAVVETTPDIMFTLNHYGIILYLNRPGLGMSASRDEAIGTSFLDYLFPQYRIVVRRILEETYQTAVPQRFEALFINERWYDCRLTAIKQGERVVSLMGVATDVTDRKETETLLQRERNMFLEGPVVVFKWKAVEGWPVEYVSPNITDLLGYDAGLFTNGEKTFSTVIYPEDLERVIKELDESSVSGAFNFEQEYRVIREDGAVRWVSDLTTIVRDKTGKITHYDGYLFDITERKENERKLKKRENCLSALVEVQRLLAQPRAGEDFYKGVLEPIGRAAEASRIYVFENYTDGNGRLLASQRAEWCAEGVESQLENPNLYEVSYDAMIPRWKEVLERGGIIKGDVSDFPKNERAILESQDILSVLVLPFFWNDRFSGFIGLDNCRRQYEWEEPEISLLKSAATAFSLAQERRHALEVLRESEGRYRSLIENIPLGIYRAGSDPDGCFIAVNTALVKMFGYDSSGELLKIKVKDLYFESDGRKRFLDKLASQGKVVREEIRMRKKNGEPVWVAVTSRAILDKQGEVNYYDGIVEEITELKYAEVELTKYREHLEELVEERASELRRTNERLQQQIVERWNAEQQIMKANEFRKRILETAATAIYTVDKEGIITSVNKAFCQETGYSEEEILGQDSRVLKEDFSVEQKAIEKETKVQCRLTTKDGRLLTVMRNSGFIRDENDEVVGGVASFVNVTEVIESREAAERASRVKSEFLANMSHEIRTPMNGIIGMSSLLKKTKLNEEQRDYIETVTTSAEALLDLINDILDISKLEAEKIELEDIEFNLQRVLEDVIGLLFHKAHERGLYLAHFVHQDVPNFVKGDPGRYRQIVTNLISNAVKFTEEGRILVSLTLEEEAEDSILIRTEVMDTGVGISQEKKDQVFDSFTQADASTSRKFGGTGLGLAISKRLVELMGGQIGVRSILGEGSTFWFTVRFKRQPIDEIFRGKQTVAMKNLRVLLVDANETNRDVLSNMLETLGCFHQEVEDERETLVILRAASDRGKKFDLVICNHWMPVINGRAIAREIRTDEKIKDTPLILLSSYGKRGDAREMKDAGYDAYLTQPIRKERLAQAIFAVMCRTGDSAEERVHHPLITRHSLSEEEMRLKILVAEDNPVNQKVIMNTLKKTGYRALCVADGKEAVEALEENDYDLVIMDCQMPVMNGFEATREIRRREGSERHTPIVALTAGAMEGDREACLNSGMDDYLAKPIREEELFEIIYRMTKNSPNLGEDQVLKAEEKASFEEVEIKKLSDNEFMNDVVTAFVSDYEERFGMLKKFSETPKASEMKLITHSMKGAAGSLKTVWPSEFPAESQGLGVITEIAEAMIYIDDETREGRLGWLEHELEVVEKKTAELKRIFFGS